MLRRLLLLAAGLGGFAVALLLWSGTAYASPPRAPEATRIPGALGGVLPRTEQPRLPVAPRPPLPKPAPPRVVRPVVRALPPVVTRTITRVQEVVPPVVVTVIAPLPTSTTARVKKSTTSAPLDTARTPTVHRRRVALRHASARHATTTRPASRTPLRAKHHRAPDPVPVGVADGPAPFTRPGTGAPCAVVSREDCRTADGWSCTAVAVACEPEMVVLRDIARPG